jgi:hypothetical protein
VGTARVFPEPLKGEPEADRLDEVLEGLPDRELVAPELLPVVGRELLDERDDVFGEDERDFDDFEGALATEVL